MKVLNPLIKRRRQRTVGARRSDASLCRGGNASQAETGNQASGEEITPVDRPLQQPRASGFLQEVFLFLSYAHQLASP
jgi:hypothetical protein